MEPTPRITTPTVTVGELLNRVKDIILEEPRRLNMDDWIIAFQHTGWHDSGVNFEHAPACGTIACVAGWVHVLLRPSDNEGPPLPQSSMADVANDLLGRDDWTRNWDGSRHLVRATGGLFAAGWVYLDPAYSDFESCDDQPEFPTPGTPEHAQIVAARIDNYLAQNPEVAARVIDIEKYHHSLRTHEPYKP